LTVYTILLICDWHAGPGSTTQTVQVHLPPCNIAASCYLVLTVLWVSVHEI